ncbi:hypothetical protein [Paenibacillus chitinolyticus]
MNSSNHQQYLKGIDKLELIKRIREFRKLNFRDLTESEISDGILSVLKFNGVFRYLTNMRMYPKGTKFFRVRPLKGSSIPNENLLSVSDFWNPPEKYVTKYGRLNKPGESLLYTAPINPFVAINEMKLEEDIIYSVIVYESKEDIKVNCIGGEYDYDELMITDREVIITNEIINDFLRDEFSRDVGVGTEYLYKISEVIAKWYFDLPPRDVQDAWAYSSVQSKESYNVCFRPDIAKEKLELKGALISKNDTPNTINVRCIAHGFDDTGTTQYYPLGSEVQKRVFPEIIIN